MSPQNVSGTAAACDSASARSALRTLFLSSSKWSDWDLHPLTADASFRRYFRLIDASGASVLLMDSPPDTEDLESYLKIDKYLLGLGLRAPQVHKADQDNGFAIIEDFGSHTYTQLLDNGEEIEPLYALAVDVLRKLHGGLQMQALDLPRYDDGYYADEAALFIDWYWLARTGAKASEPMRREFMEIWRQLLAKISRHNECLVLRDFHVDNLMLIDGESGLSSCGLLDFQDALIGSRAYDLVSLFEDARRDVDADMCTRLLDRYLQDFDQSERQDFVYDYHVLGAHRHIKVLGIFVRLCVRDDKAHYLNYLPRVQNLLEQSLRSAEMKPLADWLERNHPGPVSAPLQFDAVTLRKMLLK